MLLFLSISELFGIQTSSGVIHNLTPKVDSATLGQALATVVNENWKPKSNESAARELAVALADLSSGHKLLAENKVFSKNFQKTGLHSLADGRVQVDNTRGLSTLVEGLLFTISQNMESLRNELSSFLNAFIQTILPNNLDRESVLQQTSEYLDKVFNAYKDIWERIQSNIDGELNSRAIDHTENQEKLAIGLALADVFATKDPTPGSNVAIVENPLVPPHLPAIIYIRPREVNGIIDVWSPVLHAHTFSEQKNIGKFIEGILTKAA